MDTCIIMWQVPNEKKREGRKRSRIKYASFVPTRARRRNKFVLVFLSYSLAMLVGQMKKV